MIFVVFIKNYFLNLFFRDSNGVVEWAIIELHGDLKESSKSRDKKHIGDLCFSKSGTATLIIGNHILNGKEMCLDKPIAVLNKIVKYDTTIDKINCNVEYTVTAIVKKKLIFKGRPKPITVNVPKSFK